MGVLSAKLSEINLLNTIYFTSITQRANGIVFLKAWMLAYVVLRG